MSEAQDFTDWKGPREMTPQLWAFIEGRMELGLSKRDAAIHAGVKPVNAPTYGTRYSQYSLVIQHMDAIFADEIEEHKANVTFALLGLKQLARAKKTPEAVKLGALSKIIDFYDGTVVQKETKEEINSFKAENSLVERINNPVGVRSIENL